MRNIILLGLTSFFTDISSEMVYPLIGIYLVHLSTPYAIVGLVEGIAESIANIFKVFSGSISDRFKKRKPFIILGYSGSLLGKILLAVSSSWFFVLFARIVDRLGKGLRTAPRDALIAESEKREKKGRVFGLHRAMDTLGAVLGVIIAYLIIKNTKENTFSYNKIFLISVIPAFIGVLILFLVKEIYTGLKKEKSKIFVFKQIPYKARLYIFFSIIFSLGNSSNQFLLLKSKNSGFNTLSVILLYLVYNISFAMFSFPAGVIADKVGKKIILVLGYLIYCVVYLFFAFITVDTKNYIWLLFIIYGIYMALVEGQEKALLAEISSADYKASTIGLHYTMTGLMLLPASFIAGMLWDLIGPQAPFIFSGIMSFAAAVSIFFFL